MNDDETVGSDSALVAHEVSQLRKFLREFLSPRSTNEDVRGMQCSISSAAGTAADKVSLGPPSNGTEWLIERLSSNASAGGPSVSVFVGPQGNIDGTLRRDFAPAAIDLQRDYVNPIYVGPGEYLVIAWGGAGAASVLKAGLQVRIRRVNAPGLL